MNHFDNHFLMSMAALYGWLNQPGYGALFAVSLLASTLLPVGSEWLLAIMLTGGYEAVPTVAVATVGNTLGALSTYFVGRYGGGWLIARVWRVSPEQQESAFRRFRRYGVLALLLSWVPVVGDPLCLVAGVLKTDVVYFCLLVSAGKLVRYVVTAGLTLYAITPA